MLLSQKYRTHDGARKRAEIEMACREPWEKDLQFSTIRFLGNKRDEAPFDTEAAKAGRYHWRVERINKALTL